MKSFYLTGAAALALIAAPAHAQDNSVGGVVSDRSGATAGTEPNDTNDATPGDIIVTAQKRSERLQDVPVAISVISGDQLAAKGAMNLEGAQYLVPTLNFRKSGTAINQSLFLRSPPSSTASSIAARARRSAT
jgi:iron complex outermembrane receptor protein